mmetsp:Transcript_24715/g.50827  ORF Transcript_24715/g.50827 Transcript_24715/m.50827 type:complete len:100 (+) Transcript_24715:316-615(+)
MLTTFSTLISGKLEISQALFAGRFPRGLQGQEQGLVCRCCETVPQNKLSRADALRGLQDDHKGGTMVTDGIPFVDDEVESMTNSTNNEVSTGAQVRKDF